MRDLRIFRIFEGTNDILRLFVALSGIQYAGGHLRELQKAIKNPIGNFGIVVGEVSKRAGHAVGLASGNHLAPHVHPNLAQSAALTCKGVDAFGAAVEAAHHEEMMTKVWCEEAYTRIINNLNELKNAERLSNYKTMSEISKNVCSKNGPVQGGPLGM